MYKYQNLCHSCPSRLVQIPDCPILLWKTYGKAQGEMPAVSEDMWNVSEGEGESWFVSKIRCKVRTLEKERMPENQLPVLFTRKTRKL